MGEQPPRVVGECLEQRPFRAGEANVFPGSADAVVPQVDLDGPEPELLGPWTVLGGPPQQREDAGQQLLDAEGLAKVVVGAQVEDLELVGLVGAS